MRFARFAIYNTLLLGCLSTAIQAQTLHRDYFDGELFFKVRPQTPQLGSLETLGLRFPELAEIAQQHGFIELRKASRLGERYPELDLYYYVKFTKIQSIQPLLRSLERLPYVELAEQKPIMRYSLTPNDLNGQQWNLGQIDAEAAWSNQTGDPNIVIAIVDDAVRVTHNDLAPNVWQNPSEIAGNGLDDDGNGYVDDINGYDVADGDNNPNPPASASNSNFTHGTHCAGIACGATNNGIGIASISWNTRFMAVKGKGDADVGSTIPYAWDGVEYAIAANADVISMSWGGGGFSAFFQSVINNASSDGIIFVAAAGNDDTDQLTYPAAYNNVIGVGSTNDQDQKSGFSNFGSYIDVMAPGSGIYSTLAGSNNTYGTLSGTSMACPLVAGLVALMLSANPSQTPAQIEQCLENGCENINAQNPNYVGELGAGRINAANALNCVPPAVVFNDVAVSEIMSPGQFSCATILNPSVIIFNNGLNPLASARLRWRLNTGAWDSLQWNGLLPTGQTDTVALSPFSAAMGQNTFSVQALLPNGQPDENPLNSQLIKGFGVLPAPFQTLPFTEDFESNTFASNGWTVENPDAGITWEIVNTAGNPPGSRSARVNCFNYTSEGQRDGLVSPPISLNGYTNIELSWVYAYRRYSTAITDSLFVLVSADCGSTWTRVYGEGGGAGFATANVIGNVDFVPANSLDWCFNNDNPNHGDCNTLNLDAFANQTVLIKFQVHNDYGNNIYIDDINLNGIFVGGADFTATNTHICPGGSVQFQDASQIASTSWQWTFPGGVPATSNSASPSVTYSTPGTYSVKLKVNGTDSITKAFFVTVGVPPPVNVTANTQLVCASGTANLTAFGASAYAWSPGSSLNQTTGDQVIASPAITTTYTVIGTDAVGCTAQDTVTISVDPYTPGFTSAQIGGFAWQFSDISTGAISWSWLFGDGNFAFTQNPTHTYNGPGTYIVSLTVSNGNCNITLFDTLEVDNILVGDMDGVAGGLSANLYPNPAAPGQAVVLALAGLAVGKELAISVSSMDGRVLWKTKRQTTAPNLTIPMPVETLAGGLHQVVLLHNGRRLALRWLHP